MELSSGTTLLQAGKRSIISVGTFDGVHLGHQVILNHLVQRAADQQLTSLAVTFDPHPREVVYGEVVPLLTTITERTHLLRAAGVDEVRVIPFTKEFASLKAPQFVEKYLVREWGVGEIVVGYDHGFGYGRSGDADSLTKLGQQYGFDVEVVPPQTVGMEKVSSSLVRTILTEEGDVGRVHKMLNRFYSVRGSVIQGDRRGRTIGFPTANLELDDPRKVLPRNGVYAVRVRIDSDKTDHRGMMNIGYRPTFDGRELRLEVNLFDFNRDIYGHVLSIEFVERIREEQRFGSIDLLVQQLSWDKERCIDILGALS